MINGRTHGSTESQRLKGLVSLGSISIFSSNGFYDEMFKFDELIFVPGF
jgi:hypothetical protein